MAAISTLIWARNSGSKSGLTLDGAPVKNIFEKYESALSADFRENMSPEAARNALLEYLYTPLTQVGKNPQD